MRDKIEKIKKSLERILREKSKNVIIRGYPSHYSLDKVNQMIYDLKNQLDNSGFIKDINVTATAFVFPLHGGCLHSSLTGKLGDQTDLYVKFTSPTQNVFSENKVGIYMKGKVISYDLSESCQEDIGKVLGLLAEYNPQNY